MQSCWAAARKDRPTFTQVIATLATNGVAVAVPGRVPAPHPAAAINAGGAVPGQAPAPALMPMVDPPPATHPAQQGGQPGTDAAEEEMIARAIALSLTDGGNAPASRRATRVLPSAPTDPRTVAGVPPGAVLRVRCGSDVADGFYRANGTCDGCTKYTKCDDDDIHLFRQHFVQPGHTISLSGNAIHSYQEQGPHGWIIARSEWLDPSYFGRATARGITAGFLYRNMVHRRDAPLHDWVVAKGAGPAPTIKKV